MLEQVDGGSFTSELLHQLRERTLGGNEALRALERALSGVEGRGSLTHAILNALILWDVHALARLDRWRQRYGRRIRDCLDALGDVEALAALGMLAHDNPNWTFPVLDDSADRLTGDALGHPLLPASSRVANDVAVGPPGTLLLVTGSNMSGKSTLLRAIGLNVVLAQVYRIGYDGENPYHVCGGIQDNDSYCGPSDSLSPLGIENSDWRDVGNDGDGSWVWPQPGDPGFV